MSAQGYLRSLYDALDLRNDPGNGGLIVCDQGVNVYEFSGGTTRLVPRPLRPFLWMQLGVKSTETITLTFASSALTGDDTGTNQVLGGTQPTHRVYVSVPSGSADGYSWMPLVSQGYPESLGQKTLNSATLTSPIITNADITGGMPGIARTIRTRFTLAQINAGATVLAATAGYKYRLIDCTLIAVGGAAAGATALEITGTQSSSNAILISAAVAALTQNTVVKPNTASVSVLAAGASFIQNDANAAILIGRSGSSMTGPTHVDVILTYELAP